MIYDIRHLTTVRYATLVRLARFNLRLEPAPWPSQIVTDYRLVTDPQPWTIQHDTGPYVVNRCRMTVREPISEIAIESCFRVKVLPPPVDLESAQGPSVRALREMSLARRDLSPTSPASYIYASPMAGAEAEIADWSRRFFDDGTNVMAAGRALMEEIFTRFKYQTGATEAETPPIVAFRQRSGVCQDFAHIMIIAARAHAIPAAYVSGYLRTLPPPGKPRLVGADATHAWAALWCGEDLGWIGFDPTNNTFAKTDHIFTAMGRDFSDVSPLDGVFHGGAGQTMTVSVDVAPVEAGAEAVAAPVEA